MADEVSGVELRDIASGKLVRTVDPPAGYNILTRGGELPLNSASRRPCRALVVSTGGAVVTGIDGVEVLLIDMGGPWQWNGQFINVVSADAPFAVIY